MPGTCRSSNTGRASLCLVPYHPRPGPLQCRDTESYIPTEVVSSDVCSVEITISYRFGHRPPIAVVASYHPTAINRRTV